MFNCQAEDRNNRLQRATVLVDFLCRRCNDDTLSAFCESLIELEQKDVVDTYLRRTGTIIRTVHNSF